MRPLVLATRLCRSCSQRGLLLRLESPPRLLWHPTRLQWVEFLCFDINVHVPHHVMSKIPWYNLRAATDSLRQVRVGFAVMLAGSPDSSCAQAQVSQSCCFAELGRIHDRDEFQLAPDEGGALCLPFVCNETLHVGWKLLMEPSPNIFCSTFAHTATCMTRRRTTYPLTSRRKSHFSQCSARFCPRPCRPSRLFNSLFVCVCVFPSLLLGLLAQFNSTTNHLLPPNDNQPFVSSAERETRDEKRARNALHLKFGGEQQGRISCPNKPRRPCCLPHAPAGLLLPLHVLAPGSGWCPTAAAPCGQRQRGAVQELTPAHGVMLLLVGLQAPTSWVGWGKGGGRRTVHCRGAAIQGGSPGKLKQSYLVS